MTNNLNKLFLICLMMICTTTVFAQNKFNPAQFSAERQKYITEEAGLTQQEAAKFFPLYNEMMEKMRAIHKKLNNLKKTKPTTEAACRQAIVQRDAFEVHMKEIERTYHVKFLQVISASKLYDVLNAEGKFYKNAFKKTAKK